MTDIQSDVNVFLFDHAQRAQSTVIYNKKTQRLAWPNNGSAKINVLSKMNHTGVHNELVGKLFDIDETVKRQFGSDDVFCKIIKQNNDETLTFAATSLLTTSGVCMGFPICLGIYNVVMYDEQESKHGFTAIFSQYAPKRLEDVFTNASSGVVAIVASHILLATMALSTYLGIYHTDPNINNVVVAKHPKSTVQHVILLKGGAQRQVSVPALKLPNENGWWRVELIDVGSFDLFKHESVLGNLNSLLEYKRTRASSKLTNQMDNTNSVRLVNKAIKFTENVISDTIEEIDEDEMMDYEIVRFFVEENKNRIQQEIQGFSDLNQCDMLKILDHIMLMTDPTQSHLVQRGGAPQKTGPRGGTYIIQNGRKRYVARTV